MALMLLAIVTLVSVPVAHAGKKEHEFVGVLKCKRCHEKTDIGNQYKAWRATKHAKAFETLASRAADLLPCSPSFFGDLVHPVHTRGGVFGWQIDHPKGNAH